MEKKRDREQGGILGGVAELFDLPVDVVAGLPNTGFGVLRIRGERLTLVAMTGEELRIGGKIDGVEWVSC